MGDRIGNQPTGIGLSLHDIPAAMALLTRLPIPLDHEKAGARASAAAWAYPLAGAVVGGIAGTVVWILAALGLPSGMAAGAGLGALVLLSGGLHEDGLADCADGFGGGTTAERRLEIMKDSRVGAYGVIALGIALIMRWSGIGEAINANEVLLLAAVGAVSRMPMTLVMWAMPLARKDGLAALVGLVPGQTAAIAAAFGLILAVLLTGLAGVVLWAVALLAALPICYFSWQRIEGYTGDVLGCIQQVAEIAALAAAVAILT